MNSGLKLRLAEKNDAAAIEALISRSVHELQSDDYTQDQREAAVGRVFLVDHGLINDGSYYVVEASEGRLAGAGGWSNRKALHGGHVHDDTGERIDPALEPARIRAFFTNPDFARRGVGSIILNACEAAARNAGFTRATLGATLTGLPFYLHHGYRVDGLEQAPIGPSGSITIVVMSRTIG